MAVQKKKRSKAKVAPKDYRSLKKIWYDKLAKSGFDDIEYNEEKFKHVSHGSYFGRTEVARNYYPKMEYYSMAGQFLHNHKFQSNLEKVIWEYHANGISIRNIIKLLNKVRIYRKKDEIHAVIKALVHEMKKKHLVGYE